MPQGQGQFQLSPLSCRVKPFAAVNGRKKMLSGDWGEKIATTTARQKNLKFCKLGWKGNKKHSGKKPLAFLE